MSFKWKSLATAGIAAVLIGSQALSVGADTADDIAYLEQQQAQANAELAAVQAAITDLETQKKDLLSKIDAYDAELVTVITTINLLDGQIKDKEKELVQTGKDLDKAEAEMTAQYEAMKERIRFLYEEGGDAGWEAMLLTEGLGISNILDKADYTQELYNYDRRELESYADTVDQVEKLQEQQTTQKAALETMKHEQEDGKAYLETLLEKAKKDSKNTDERIAQANDIAAQYMYLIEQQNIAIGELYARQEAERRAAEEAAAAAAAAAAAQQAAAYQSAGYDDYDDGGEYYEEEYYEESYDSGSEEYYEESYDSGSEDYYEEDYSEDEYYEEESYDDSGYEEESGSSSYTPSSSGGVTGQDVVNYALQYVGNPYVWGGTDPVNGADCSGFVQSVYRDMGYDISRTTYTQLNDGVSVSYADAQPGDLINYGSHVAIYMGDGQIVHAANEQLGITTSTNATYQPIVDVRRIIN